LLEEGDMISAAKEKDRLEVKQRKVRKDMEKHKMEHVPSYFRLEMIKEDGQEYHIYNGLYFEEDRKN
jgi:hypothetical protein